MKNLDELISYICDMISIESDIEPNVNPKLLSKLTPNMKVKKYIESILSQIDKPIVLAIDEVNRLFEYNSVFENFILIWNTWFNNPKNSELWKKFKIIIAYSTEPLFEFNKSVFEGKIGNIIKLKNFNFKEIKELSEQYGLNLKNDELNKIKEYIGGHPYLTNSIFYNIASENKSLSELLNINNFENHIKFYNRIFYDNPNMIESIRKVVNNQSYDIKDIDILEASGFITGSINNRKS